MGQHTGDSPSQTPPIHDHASNHASLLFYLAPRRDKLEIKTFHFFILHLESYFNIFGGHVVIGDHARQELQKMEGIIFQLSAAIVPRNLCCRRLHHPFNWISPIFAARETCSKSTFQLLISFLYLIHFWQWLK